MEQSFSQAISVLILALCSVPSINGASSPYAVVPYLLSMATELLDTPIKLADVKEVIYCQHQRYEHVVRFRYHNRTFKTLSFLE